MHCDFLALVRRLSFFFLFISPGLFAQDYRPGYIIKNNLDSINGFVEYAREKMNTSRCMFRSTRKGRATTYTPVDLRAYGFYGDKRYESMNIPDSTTKGKVFVRVIIEGPMRLYQYRRTFMVAKDTLISLPTPKNNIIDTPKGKVELEDSRYKGLLNFLLTDCKMSADETRYTESSLTKLVNNYNRCMGTEPKYEKSKPIFKANLNVFGGYTSSNMTLTYPDYVELEPSNTIFGGVGVDLSSPRIFDRVFFTIDASYVNSFYQGYYQKKSGSDIIHTDVHMEFTYIKIPIGFRYHFLKDGNTPYIKGGLVISPVTSHTFETIEERETLYQSVFTTKYSEGELLEVPKGIWFGVGYIQKISKGMQLFFEIRYDQGEGFIGTAIQQFSDVRNYNVMLGIRF